MAVVTPCLIVLKPLGFGCHGQGHLDLSTRTLNSSVRLTTRAGKVNKRNQRLKWSSQVPPRMLWWLDRPHIPMASAPLTWFLVIWWLAAALLQIDPSQLHFWIIINVCCVITLIFFMYSGRRGEFIARACERGRGRAVEARCAEGERAGAAPGGMCKEGICSNTPYYVE